jgi:hypothetical protein
MLGLARYAALCLVLVAIAACARQQYPIARHSTGTCEGACDYYLACKRSDDQQVFGACYQECTDFFSDQQALRELERLTCDELVAFIEGPSGREPGQTSRR